MNINRHQEWEAAKTTQEKIPQKSFFKKKDSFTNKVLGSILGKISYRETDSILINVKHMEMDIVLAANTLSGQYVMMDTMPIVSCSLSLNRTVPELPGSQTPLLLANQSQVTYYSFKKYVYVTRKKSILNGSAECLRSRV